MKYTIDLDNGEGKGYVKLGKNCTIVVVSDTTGEISDTGIASCTDTLQADINLLYGDSVWALQSEPDLIDISLAKHGFAK